MKDFFKSPVLLAILGFLAFILVSLAIWFIGPLLAFGDLRPLGSVAMRVTAIGLLLVLIVLLLLGWSVSAVGVTCLCLLIWNAGPLLAFGSAVPLATEGMRWLVIGLVVLCYIIWAVYTLWNLMRNDQEFANRMLKRDKDAPKALAKKEINAINELAKKAISQLKEMHMTMAGGTGSVVSGLRRLVEGKRYLYELPWYMIIGTPGAGKTSALLNSGLSFPVAEQMGTASAQMTLSKNSGTTNCVWWFTNEAVLIDTAGRYTNPDDGLVLDAAPVPVPEPAPVNEEGKPKVEKIEPPPPAQLINRAEWKGFLNVLRNVRTRAPINGALLAVDVAKLLSDDDAQLMAHAAQLRARLGELRQELSIRFPVYVVLTKTDVLKGFADYFSSLTTEARAQVWGFTLPWKGEDKGFLSGKKKKTASGGASTTVAADWPLAKQVEFEMAALQSRLAQGVATRLQEEFELDRRQALYVLPQELAAVGPRLAKLLDAVFSDSRFDTTQLTHTLRGVYLTSVMQYDDKTVTADSTALVPRLMRGLGKLAGRLSGTAASTPPAAGIVRGQASLPASSTRSYFVNDALTRVVFTESHLVKPNLKWEARFRLLRLLGHALVIAVFFWMAGGLILSHANNKSYLEGVSSRTEALAGQIQHLYAKMNMPQTTEVLTQAQALPTHVGLDLANPSSAFGFGLYSAEPVAQMADVAYNHLQDTLILPILIQRMEYVLRDAVATEDAKAAYEALRVYLLLHDAAHFRETPNAAADLRNWIFKDWQDSAGSDSSQSRDADAGKAPSGPLPVRKVATSPPAAGPGAQGLAPRFGNSTAMMGQLEAMFSGRRVVQSSTAINEALVRQVRHFLDGSSSSKRLYERAKAELLNDAPQDFTLVRALGPQAGTLFRRASGQTIEKGISGLFTYDGYHELFAKRLPEMIVLAQKEDAWVMGRQLATPKAASTADSGAKSKAESQALTEEIRRQYLSEYAEKWTDFLNDLRVVQAEGAGSLSFELNILRQFAAPDSPLVRLARMAARETTLSRPLKTRSEGEKSLLDKANDQIDQNKAKVSQNLGLSMRPEQRLERLVVDERFSALREVVTGQSEGAAAPGGKPALEGITGALNDYYTVLLVADSAIAAGSLPPAGADAATKLRIEAGKLPAPFREVFLGVSDSGAGQIANGAATILRVQAQAQMDRLVGLMAMLVSEPCRRNIAGRYPFAASAQEVAVEDFNALFASGGAADEYFTKYLMPLVDTSARPWRYKAPGAFNMLVGTEGIASGQAPAPAVVGPTLTGELVKLLAASGPNPDSFAQMAQIREVFFREPGAKRLAWKLDLAVQQLDPTVTELVLDIDGQSQRYAHGPVQAMPVQWPGPRGGTMSEITAFPRIKSDTSAVSARGPWALLRLVEKGKLITSANTGQVGVEFLFDNRRAVVSFSGAGTPALTGTLLKNFSCPGRSA